MKELTYNSRVADKFVIRLPDGMRDSISELARQDLISMNTYIVQKLTAAIEADEAGTALTVRAEVGWVPQEGMLVQFKNSTGSVIPWKIDAFAFSEGAIKARLCDLVTGDKIWDQLSSLEPYRM